MSLPLTQSDEDLSGQALQQAHSGDVDAAKAIASRITDPAHQRSAWMGILYAQFYGLKDLHATKETVLSLPDTNLWMGSWVHDLVAFTAQSGDIEGAKTFVNRLSGEAPRGLFLSLIAAAQARQGDYAGAESTHAAIATDNSWHDLGLVFIIREVLSRGDTSVAEALLNRVQEPEIKSGAMKLFAK